MAISTTPTGKGEGCRVKDGGKRAGTGTGDDSGAASDADGSQDHSQDAADAATQGLCPQPEGDLIPWTQGRTGMCDVLNHRDMDDLSFSLATVIRVPRHQRSLLEALNTHIDDLFARALVASRRAESDGRTPPFLL